jgi:pimeloyl-ACP methyl ester carboxylesterase
MSIAKNVVLVHGGFVDGSGWQGVYHLLRQDGYKVTIVQNPTLSLEGDAEVTRRVLQQQDGPTVLVGHSYGGAVISEAGTHSAVSALVYITAFAPDKGESVNTLIADPPPAQRAMAERAGATVTEAPGSHSIYLSQPQAVANLIRQAAAAAAR